MPPHAVQPYLGGSSEQRFMMDRVLTAVVLSAMVNLDFDFDFDFLEESSYFNTHVIR